MAHPGIDLISAFLQDASFTVGTIEDRRAGMEAVTAGAVLPDGVAVQEAIVGDRPAEWHTPVGVQPAGVILYLHGGAYCVGSIATHRSVAARLALAAQLSVCLIDYRLAPEHPFPAGLDDAVAAYRDLLANGIRPDRIAIAGDSAGGGLTIALLLALHAAGDPLPAAGVAISPWADLTLEAGSYDALAAIDPLISREGLAPMATAYLLGVDTTGDADPGERGVAAGGADVRDPLVSPVFATDEALAALPPLLIEVGERECLLDDAVTLAERASAAGVDVVLNRYPEMIHVFQAFPPDLIPEGDVSLKGIGAFINDRFG